MINTLNTSGDTIAIRIARALSDKIVSGVLDPGTRLRQDQVAVEFSAKSRAGPRGFQAPRSAGPRRQ